jgi:alpha-methylacyl-CoA racemase
MSKLLEGFTVLDFTHRLPGPLAGKILVGLGAKVIKVEDVIFKDPFIEGLFSEFDESFPHWYEELNEQKELLRLDFKSDSIKDEIQCLLQSADGILMGLPPKVQKKLGIDEDSLKEKNLSIAVVEMLASKEHKSAMHDLNALAMTGLLALHIEGRTEPYISPPFLPIAGIAFGHKAATDLLATMLDVKRKKQAVFHQTYLFESTDEIFGAFWPKKSRGRSKFLHNGLYPCYGLYKTKDQKYVALAAVEEKFWIKFCELFKQEIEPMKRFYTEDKSVFDQISKCFLSYDQSQIEEIIRDEDFCLSLI